jgi:hypothetical protein
MNMIRLAAEAGNNTQNLLETSFEKLKHAGIWLEESVKKMSFMNVKKIWSVSEGLHVPPPAL